MARWRSWPFSGNSKSVKNMCSVRQRPMPWAPNSRALRASCGVSALVRMPRRRRLSPHFMRGSAAGVDNAFATIEGDPLPFLHNFAANSHRFGFVFDVEFLGADDAALAPTAG